MNYKNIAKEETLKARVFQDYFSEWHFAYEPNIDNIDFIVTDIETRGAELFPAHYLWAEVKKGIADTSNMLTQLILTCKKTVDRGLHLPPPYIAAFDAQKIAFVPFYDIMPIFVESDINWKTPHNDYNNSDFKKIREKLMRLCPANAEDFFFETDDNEIKNFIKNNLRSGGAGAKIKITKNNFVHIYYRWAEHVQPQIDISNNEWRDFNKAGLFDSDFFRADMISSGSNTIIEKLKVILENDKYNLTKEIGERIYKTEIVFKDNGNAYKKFWNQYERPPAEEYSKYIIERRDLLVPQNIREVKGEFFTPQIWVEKSQEYLEKVLGENWQEEYYIWDCCAGSGNLLAGLQHKERIWTSDISIENVKNMHGFLEYGNNMLKSHIFQFDFLNDSFDKLPPELFEIINDNEKRKKLIVYINPPYAETMSYGIKHKAGLNLTKVNIDYNLKMGNCANRELFVQFLTRIYFEIPDCVIGHFSTLKILNAPHFINFREYFRAKLLKLFIVPADTFDNVKGKFPVGFFIWNTHIKERITKAAASIYDGENNFIGIKTFQPYDDVKFINEWIITTRNKKGEKKIGFIACLGNDFQAQKLIHIMNDKKQMAAPRGSWITDKNIIEICVYFAVRKVLPATWLNDRDQFLFPNAGWESDAEFQNDCFVYTLFNNNISCRYGINHWIPFSEKEVGAKEQFESDFIKKMLNDRCLMLDAKNTKPNICLSAYSIYQVLSCGLALWRYYHAKIKTIHSAPVNASFYDIREFFQGRNENGKMNSKSKDEKYTLLLAELRAAQKKLAQKIAPKIYEYGFLRE